VTKVDASGLSDVRDEAAFLRGLPAVRPVSVDEVARVVAGSKRRLVVLDDDPTGTQTVAGVPVLTTWRVEDLRWALSQDVTAFFVLTNTRSLSSVDAEARNREIVANLVDAAQSAGVDFVIASRSDSTLRGHFPLETDVLCGALADVSDVVDGIIMVPAYIEAGRFTIDSTHWVRSPAGLIPAGESEFARDATFGYASSDLRDYVEEKTRGRWPARDVERITLFDIRDGGVSSVVTILESLGGGRPVVVDAACDDDLRVLALALLEAEQHGKRFVYRVGPSFVRARAGLDARAALSAADVHAIREHRFNGTRDAVSPHGLIIVGSHVAQTSRQLERLRKLDGLHEVELDVNRLLSPDSRDDIVATTICEVVTLFARGDVVIETSRHVIRGGDPAASLTIARTVSAALVAVVKGVVAQTEPDWIVAKGGITSSDIATEALEVRRAWVRGPLLDGIVSLWEPAPESPWTMPYVVFAGNVGSDDALAAVVTKLRGNH
jgi:uncharacterized protein YgbK (DUF1537 family)